MFLANLHVTRDGVYVDHTKPSTCLQSVLDVFGSLLVDIHIHILVCDRSFMLKTKQYINTMPSNVMHHCLLRGYVFRAQTQEIKERGGNQSTGIDFFITQERVIFLDTQASKTHSS